MIAPYVFLLVLLGFAYLDVKRGEVSNSSLFLFFVGASVYRLIVSGPEFLWGFLLIVPFSLYMFYTLKDFGGADSKLLIAMLPALPFYNGSANVLVVTGYFIILLGAIGVIYALTFRTLFKDQKTIPFIPAIALTYAVMIFINIH